MQNEMFQPAWWRTQALRCRRDVIYLANQVRLLAILIRDPRVPWTAKLIAACAIGYIFSPIQLIPSFIPVIGQMDDVAVLLGAMKLIRRLTPDWLRQSCERKLRTPFAEQLNLQPKSVNNNSYQFLQIC